MWNSSKRKYFDYSIYTVYCCITEPYHIFHITWTIYEFKFKALYPYWKKCHQAWFSNEIAVHGKCMPGYTYPSGITSVRPGKNTLRPGSSEVMKLTFAIVQEIIHKINGLWSLKNFPRKILVKLLHCFIYLADSSFFLICNAFSLN